MGHPVQGYLHRDKRKAPYVTKTKRMKTANKENHVFKKRKENTGGRKHSEWVAEGTCQDWHLHYRGVGGASQGRTDSTSSWQWKRG